MSGDFWARKLAGSPATAPQSHVAPSRLVPAAPVQGQPWWAPQPVSQPQMGWAEESVAPLEADPDAETSITALLAGATGYRPTKRTLLKAKSARLTERCPECDSGDYFQPEGSNAKKRCFDCGYPVVQSASGNSLPSTRAPGQQVAATRQLASPGFQGQTIVGRV